MANRYIVKEHNLDERQKALFVDYKKKRRINTRLVRSSWKRVVVGALLYAIALSFGKVVWYEVFGQPTFFDDGVRAMEKSSAPQVQKERGE